MTLISMRMSETPFSNGQSPSLTSSKSIRALIHFGNPSSSWNGGRGDLEPNFDLMLGDCSRQEGKNFFLGDVSKMQIYRQNSTVQFDFPAILLADQCDVVITLSIKSKCGQMSDSSFLPLNFNCSSVENSNCTIADHGPTPTCRVSNFESNFDWSTRKLHLEWEAESSADLIGRLEGFYYVINQLENTKENRQKLLQFDHVTSELVANDTVFLDKQNSTTVNLTLNFNVSKNSLYVMKICEKFHNDKDDDNYFKIVNWDTIEKYLINIKDDPDPNQIKNFSKSNLILIISIFSILIILILIILFFLKKKFKNRNLIKIKSIKELKSNNLDQLENDQYRYVLSPRRFDHWEISRKKLQIYEDQKLGSGAFGSVYKGKISGKLLTHVNANAALAEQWMQAENCDVAVKMLPDYADDISKSEFNKEINLMKQLGYNDKLVNMLGCVTADDPLCLIVEYCSDGDLLRYLRDRRKYMATLRKIDAETVDTQYLEQKGFIHRDLAARNILVDKGRKIKIGDFGLCRYSTPDSTYVCKGGRLPLKWMALEAIKTHEFTTKSDVYDLMLNTWRENPEDRPNFGQLTSKMAQLLEKSTDQNYYYLNLDQEKNYYKIGDDEESNLISNNFDDLDQERLDHSDQI
uniref:Protein kinase domain-containing protein n=1 Tax=Romanomermis culicivorax TaxID=13658 RepID=A0A915L5V5_ROMCU